MLPQFITQLKTDLGLEQALDANEDGSFSLRFEPEIDVLVKEDQDAVISFFTKLADLPQLQVEEYLLRTMIANLFGRETGGSILGLDNEGKRVVLLDFLEREHNYTNFRDRLEDFVNYAEAWRLETVEFSTNREENES